MKDAYTEILIQLHQTLSSHLAVVVFEGLSLGPLHLGKLHGGKQQRDDLCTQVKPFAPQGTTSSGCNLCAAQAGGTRDAQYLTALQTLILAVQDGSTQAGAEIVILKVAK